MDIGTVLHGFRLVRQEWVAEIEAHALVFVHEPTRAEVVGLCNQDDNKTFCLTVRTLPPDDTGVAHILEHAVLNGSRRYPSKEPFVELLKSSLCTFLNAFTYPDRTVYPVSSRNQQDFHNLMDVYLDAVFHPKLTRQTFMQEGWHDDLAAADAALEFSGVVYNEMLGASSSPEAVLAEQLERGLFPSSIYGRNSGGDPERIPDLTYEQFTAFHRQFYHPSNSRTVLYGDFDVAARLAHLAEYFGAYAYQPPPPPVQPQPRFRQPVAVTAPYPVTPGTEAAGKSYVLRGWLLERTADPEFHLAAGLLARILTGSPAAPLYQALIESRLGDDVVGWFETELRDAFGCVGLKGVAAAQGAAVEQTIDQTLRRLADGGLDRRTVEAALNATEFRLREANYGGYSKGLIYALQMAASWLYDGEPLALLKYEAPLAAIRRQAGQGYFENLIRRSLLDNPHRVTVCLQPDPEFENRRLTRLQQRLAARQAALDPAATAAVVAASHDLRAAQLRPDPPEVVATIPKLPLACLPPRAETLPIEAAGTTPALWFSEQPTNGIGYLKLAFDAGGLPLDLLPYVPFFCQATLQTGTARRDYVELTEELDLHTGGLGAGYSATARYGQPAGVLAQVQYAGKALRAKLPRLLELLTEVLTTARLDHTRRLIELAQIARASMESSINNHGNFFVACRLGAYQTPAGVCVERTHGLEQYYFLERLVHELQTAPAAVTARLHQIRDWVCTRANLQIHLTGGREELAALQHLLPGLAAALPAGPAAAAAGPAPALLPGDEGFILPIKVHFVGKAVNLYRHGFAYRGTFEVLNKLLSRDYLWNKVRVQGNAYGCFCSFDLLAGSFACISYRDPNLEETLAVFDQTADYLTGLRLSQDELEKLIVGTIAGIDAPRSPDEKGAVAFRRQLTGVSGALIQSHREQLLACTLADLRAYAEVLRQYRDHGQLCVLGGEPKLRAAAGRLASVRHALGQPAKSAS